MCLQIHRPQKGRRTQLCFGEPGAGKQSRLGYELLDRDGSTHDEHTIHARVKRVSSTEFSARFDPGDASLSPRRYRWRAVSQWSGAACPLAPPAARRKSSRRRAQRAAARTADPCSDSAPDHGDARFRLHPVALVGCRDSLPHLVFNGSRERPMVALTFDDGPSPYTDDMLSILRRHHARGTFFEIGDQIPGNEGITRDVYRSGSELGNHSLHHEDRPGTASMRETNRHIKDATGFRPCLFRPPGGDHGGSVVSDAAGLGMNTVIWDVDPMDWSLPGSDAIYQRVVNNTQPGSIILLHDGGGPRGETVSALPRIIETLRARGYRLVTVSRLLGQRLIWRPVR
jgi:peptidoglycan/xylan/chitin deacetylase (PgdA/CDA1 family)